MSEAANIKADEEMKAALLQLFSMASMSAPAEEITASDVMSALMKIKSQLSQPAAAPSFNAPSTSDAGTANNSLTGDAAFSAMASMLGDEGLVGKERIGKHTILIVGELGIITYQLKMAFARYGAQVTIVKGVDEALLEYQKRDYTGVLIDVFMPTEREGMLVLQEIHRMAKDKEISTEIAVLATHVAAKEKHFDLKELAKDKGADCFIEKTEGWHQRAMDFFAGQLDPADKFSTR